LPPGCLRAAAMRHSELIAVCVSLKAWPAHLNVDACAVHWCRSACQGRSCLSERELRCQGASRDGGQNCDFCDATNSQSSGMRCRADVPAYCLAVRHRARRATRGRCVGGMLLRGLAEAYFQAAQRSHMSREHRRCGPHRDT